MKRRRLIILGTLASSPYAGMAWMHMQIAVGLRRLGHDVYYIEAAADWPYDPVRQTRVNDSDYAVPYLAKVADSFGLGDRWGYRRSFSDKEWLGLTRERAEDLLAQADAVFNIAGATSLLRPEEGLKVGRLIYYATDPVYDEIGFATGDPPTRRMVDEHEDIVTYGENIGTDGCPIPPLPRLRAKTRQPVLINLWQKSWPPRAEFTTVCNWRQVGHDIDFCGETYYWSKHREFLKFVDLPRRTDQPIELAMGLMDAAGREPPVFKDPIPAVGMTSDERRVLAENGWRLTDSHTFTRDPWSYRDYICASRGEFTVAKDQNVRLRSGWFSERSACYLAAGRPVVTQDTGFSSVLPTGEGLFAFNNTEEILAAFDAINTDYERHSRAARAIAEEYFRAETVLARLLEDLGL
jgi:hypothetical protein